jgi:hypothetical protein
VTRTVIDPLGNSENIAYVDYATVEGKVKEVTDYIVDSGTITFNQGESFKAISLSIIDNIVAESETFSINLSTPYQSTIGEYSKIMVSIKDNDMEPKSEDPSSWGLSNLDGTHYRPNNRLEKTEFNIAIVNLNL